jgi:BirA family transcriptional regulator, biotin operon repressor / biotin---[acetyl-CoA-carboxylase] ligase
MSQRDSLCAAKLRAELTNPYIGNEVLVVEATSSTNELVWQMAQDGTREGLVVFAESQSAGRGQRGNRWESAARLGLWFSIFLRPKIRPADSAGIVTWAMQTVAATIDKEVGIGAQIKLPNDIYVLGKKVAGVLVELRVEKSGAYAAIVGIGLNMNHAAEDFSEKLRATATSLAIACGKKIDRQKFAVALLQNLDRSYRAVFVA